MKEYLINLLAAVTMAALFSLAALWGWNHLFGFVKIFPYDIKTMLAVMAISFIFTGVRLS